MKKIVIFSLIVIVLTFSIAFAKIYDTSKNVLKDEKLPFTDLQIEQFEISGRNAGQPKVDKDGNQYYKNHYAINEIIKASKIGLINGYEDKTFRPDNNITRAEFIKLAITLAMNRNFDFKAMPDVVGNNYWASPYVAVAQMQNVIDENEYSLEELNEPIARIEMICILSKIQINMKGIEQYTLIENLPNYDDIEDLSSTQKELLLHACKYELIDGMRDVTSIRPHDNLTRAESAVAIMRIY